MICRRRLLTGAAARRSPGKLSPSKLEPPICNICRRFRRGPEQFCGFMAFPPGSIHTLAMRVSYHFATTLTQA